MFDLTGRVALVTGGGRGIGAATAEALVSRGAAVVVNDLHEDRAADVAQRLRSAGGRATVATADVSDAAAITAAFGAAADELGPVDILVNNAGIPESGVPMSAFADSRPEDWEAMLRLNAIGIMNCTLAALPSMTERGWGRIVTMTSDSGRTGEPQLAAYAASKAAAAGFVRSLSKEVGASGVTCNSLSLGTVLPDDHAMAPEAYERHARRYAVRRLGRPADVAAAVVWLASDEAGWVTGQTIPVNGGYAAS